MKTILDLLSKNNLTDKVPIWFMRQAGRYLPEYKNITEISGKTFFQIIEDSKIAAEITMQPIKRFNFDAAIIFSDILLLPRIMGCDIEMIKDYGPKIRAITKAEELDINNVESKSYIIKNLVSQVKYGLNDNTTLIGFAGGVFTVAAYIVSNIKLGENKLLNTKDFIYKNKKDFLKIMDLLIEATILYLNQQIESGVEVVQIFDSLAGDLSEDDFDEFIIAPTKKIIKGLKKCFVIGFPKGAGEKYVKYVEELGLDGVSVDYTLSLDWVKNNLLPITTVQGNLDPFLLAFDQEKSLAQTQKILDKLAGGNFIFNLGHGIMKNTPIDNVNKVVELVKNYNKKGKN